MSISASTDVLSGSNGRVETAMPTRKKSRSDLQPEEAFEFIRVCVSLLPETTRRDRMKALMGAGIDWRVVQREASRHGVLPLLYHNLEQLVGKHVPPSLIEHIQEYQRRLRIHSTFLVKELGRVFRHFERHDVTLLAQKGPVLAQGAYGDVALRRYVDLDVLIPRDRFSIAKELLEEIGYTSHAKWEGRSAWRNKLALHLSGQRPYSRGRGIFNLDVHTRLMPPGYSFTADFDTWWKRSERVDLGQGGGVRTFSPEDMVLILSFHGVKNQWRALKHVVDIAKLIGSQPGLDWSGLIERAQALRATRVLRLGLQLAHDLVKAPLPPDILKWVQSDPMDDTAAFLKDYLRNRHQRSELTYGERVQLQLATKDTVTGQLRYGGYSLMQHIWSNVLKP